MNTAKLTILLIGIPLIIRIFLFGYFNIESEIYLLVDVAFGFLTVLILVNNQDKK